MADIIPPTNLPPEAQPWGREITRLATDLETNVNRGLNDVTNTQNALQSNVELLANKIANGFLDVYTKAQVDALLAAITIAASQIVSGTVTRDVSNSSTSSTNIGGTNGTITNITTDLITSLATRNRTITTNYAGLWIDGTGVIGIVPSTLASKKNIEDWDFDVESFLNVSPKTFLYKTEDDNASLHVGLIVEDLIAAGLEELIIYRPDDKGNVTPQGIEYSLLAVPLLAVVRKQEEKIKNLEERLSKLEDKVK
jgi:hypothetical protein